tara:strand:+ start:28 stop:429 length:402 start_codon:yes stop_codon:yes gene_type:complete
MQLEMFKDKSNLPEPDSDTQICKICSKEKTIDRFHKQITMKSGYDKRCKVCAAKDATLRRGMRFTYKSIKPKVCDCCGEPSEKSLVVDHDHDTLKFRGWLCASCNLGIGHLGDNIEGVEKAIAFLRKHYETRT